MYRIISMSHPWIIFDHQCKVHIFVHVFRDSLVNRDLSIGAATRLGVRLEAIPCPYGAFRQRNQPERRGIYRAEVGNDLEPLA